MEWIHSLAELGFSPLNLVLMGMLYLLMAHLGIAPKIWNGTLKKEKNGFGLKEVVDYYQENFGKQITQLGEYYNHDITDKLKDIAEGQKEISKNLSEQKDTLKDISRTLENIREYGVKCINKDK